MDFIERWLGISPDGGNGMFEAAILVSLIVALAVAAIAVSKRSHQTR